MNHAPAGEKEKPMTPGDYRATIARLQIPIYRLAAEVSLHPSRLGQMLGEKIPMPADVAARLSEAIDAHRSVPVA
jgi:plasmid maintenance system antidote protein VapI